MSAPVLPGERSMQRIRTCLVANGWAVVSESCGLRHATTSPRSKTWQVGRITAEKTVTFGKVRLVAAWEKGRFVEAMVGRDGYARAYIVPTIGFLKELIADPGCGFVEIPVESVLVQGMTK